MKESELFSYLFKLNRLHSLISVKNDSVPGLRGLFSLRSFRKGESICGNFEPLATWNPSSSRESLRLRVDECGDAVDRDVLDIHNRMMKLDDLLRRGDAPLTTVKTVTTDLVEHATSLSSPTSKSATSQESSTYVPLIAKLALRVLIEEEVHGYQNSQLILKYLIHPTNLPPIQFQMRNDEKGDFEQTLVQILRGSECKFESTTKEGSLLIGGMKVLDFVNRIWGVLYLNAMRTEETGLTLWALPSFINHSCSPNVALQFEDGLLHMHAARDIEEDEELFIDYAVGQTKQHNWTPTQKQEYLYLNYGFDCKVGNKLCPCSKSP